jgi:uncharacterized repeat protein (TIGR03803 family)
VETCLSDTEITLISGNGTIFGVNADGTGFTNLHNFTKLSGALTNVDGIRPFAGLTLLDGVLYGTASGGGTTDWGTIFKVNTNGSQFVTLHNFIAGSGSSSNITNNDGVFPQGGLISSGTTLYGTTLGGGDSARGTVFAVNVNGTGFTNLHVFAATSGPNYTNWDGSVPTAAMVLSGDLLFGTANGGGNSGDGTVFALNLVPTLEVSGLGDQMIFSWPSWAPNFILQSTTNLDPLTVWSTNLPAPITAGGRNLLTNPISGALQFYRLSQ